MFTSLGASSLQKNHPCLIGNHPPICLIRRFSKQNNSSYKPETTFITSSYVNKLSSYNQSIIKMYSTSQTREVSRDPRDTMEALRKSSRTKNKQLKQSSKRSVSFKDSNSPKIIKSLSSSEKSKLASLSTPMKGSHKNDPDSNYSKRNLLSKMSFWYSPDLSVGMDKLFKVIKLNEDSKFLIISMDLGNVRNIIQLSDQDLHDATSLFSRQDLRDPNFQASIIKILCLGKCFKLVLKE
jgi:hypothetical protein